MKGTRKSTPSRQSCDQGLVEGAAVTSGAAKSLKCSVAGLMGIHLLGCFGNMPKERCYTLLATVHYGNLFSKRHSGTKKCPLLSSNARYWYKIIIMWLKRNLPTKPASNEGGSGTKKQSVDDATPVHQFSRSVMSNSWWPHVLQHARPPCPSPTPRACSNSYPSGQWCHPTMWSSVLPFSCLQSFPASGSFPMSHFFASGGKSSGSSFSASVPPMNIQDWFPLELTGLISLLSKGLSRVFSSTTSPV